MNYIIIHCIPIHFCNDLFSCSHGLLPLLTFVIGSVKHPLPLISSLLSSCPLHSLPSTQSFCLAGTIWHDKFTNAGITSAIDSPACLPPSHSSTTHLLFLWSTVYQININIDHSEEQVCCPLSDHSFAVIGPIFNINIGLGQTYTYANWKIWKTHFQARRKGGSLVLNEPWESDICRQISAQGSFKVLLTEQQITQEWHNRYCASVHMHAWVLFFKSLWKERNQINVSQQSNTAKEPYLLLHYYWILISGYKSSLCQQYVSVHKGNWNVSTFHSRWVFTLFGLTV